MWVTDIEEAALLVAQDNAPTQPTGLCLTQNDKSSAAFYRVLFARYIPYRSGSKTCYITFIPSRPRQFEVKRRSSIILSALILSIRFRQKVLPYAELLQERVKSKKIDYLYALERTLHQVETEAIEFGLDLGVDEDVPLLQYIPAGPAYDFVEKSMNEWNAGRRKLGDAVLALRKSASDAARNEALSSAEAIAVEELKRVSAVNGKFIKILTEELSSGEQLEGET